MELTISVDVIDQLFTAVQKFEKSDSFNADVKVPVQVLTKNWIVNDLLVVEIMESRSKSLKGWLYNENVDYIFVMGAKKLFDRTKLRERVEELCKEKNYTKKAEANYLMIKEDRIVAFVKLDEVE